jgi:2-polyprenyl-6-methoxyphenol hydroxylase-like FAD-dependent oxidoreductase
VWLGDAMGNDRDMKVASHTPVLIVGGGPSGLAMACELARHGVAFRVIDKNPERTLTSNAAAVQARTLEIFDQIGLLERFKKRGIECRAVNIRSGHVTAKISLDHLNSFYKYILMLPQAETEAILNQRLEEYSHQVERMMELIGVDQSEKHFSIQVKNQHGEIESLTCDWLIACDGSHSIVREKCGLYFSGEDINEQFMVADAVMDTFLTGDEVHAYTNSGKALAVIPIAKRKYRLAANLHLDYPRKIFTEKEVKELVIERARGDFNVESISWISPFWIHSKTIDKLNLGKVYFIGDAAHIHSPVGGQGMNTGIQDAYNLAWKLALVINGHADEKLLESYQAERYPVIADIVRETEKITKWLITDNAFINWSRSLIIRLVNNSKYIADKIGMRISQLAIRYQSSTIIEYQSLLGSLIKPGERSLDVQIDNAKRLHDYFKNPKHNILLFAGLKPTQATIGHLFDLQVWVRQNYSEVSNTYIVVNDERVNAEYVIYDNEDRIHKCYGVKRQAAFIIRPDNYLGAQTAADYYHIQQYFDQMFIGSD